MGLIPFEDRIAKGIQIRGVSPQPTISVPTSILVWPLLISPAAYRSLSVSANTRNGALVLEPGARAIRRCNPTATRPGQTCSPLV